MIAPAAAILGHIDNPIGHRICRRQDRHRRAAHGHSPAGRAGDAEQRLHEFGTSRTDQPVKPKDLALAQGEGNIGEFGRVAHVFDRQDVVTDGAVAIRKDLADIAADHHLDQLCLGDVLDHPVADELAVAKHRVAVRDAEDLVELVADEQDRLALRFQGIDQLVELFDFLVAQRGGRLVHDDHAGVDRQRARNCNKVLVGNAQIAQSVVGINFCPDRAQDAGGVLRHGSPVDQTETPARRVTQKDVFGDGQFIKQNGFLMDRRDPGICGRLGGREIGLFTVNADRAAIWLVNPREDLHDGGLARAVLSHQSGDLTGIKTQRHLGKCGHARKGLGDAVKRENGNRLGGNVRLGVQLHHQGFRTGLGSRRWCAPGSQ